MKSLPDIIAISETKLNENTSVNLHIPGYLFVRTDSKSYEGGAVGLCISNQLVFSRTRDLDISRDGIEFCWIKIIRKRQKNVLIGCVYWHPKEFLVTPVSKGEKELTPQIIAQFLRRLLLPKYLKSLSVSNLKKAKKLYTNSSLDLLRIDEKP